jgi:hypothetical protein
MESDPFFKELVESFRESINAESASLFILDETGDNLICVAGVGYARNIDPQGETIKIQKQGKGLTPYIADAQKARISNTPPIYNLIGVTLSTKEGDLIGLLKAENKGTEADHFSPEDEIIAQSFGKSAAIALEIEQKNRRLKKFVYAFVLMPFDVSFDDIYKYGIKKAVESLGITCERVDEIQYVGGILEQVFQCIEKARFIIADMTGRNPNVFYEVGYCHAIKKDVILCTQSAEDIPFDLRGYNHIVYGGKISVLEEALRKRISAFINEE